MNDPRVYLAQILESLDHIVTYTKAGREPFLRDPLIQDAVIRRFEIVGEAVKRIPEAYRQKHPEIPWRELAAFFETSSSTSTIESTSTASGGSWNRSFRG